MTKLKFESGVAAAAGDALEPYIRPLYASPGMRLMAIIELATTERTEPSPGSEKVPTVKVRIMHLEIPNEDQEEYIRAAQRALYFQRTARGTFDDKDEGEQLEFSPDTLRLAAGQIHAVGYARLKSYLQRWQEYAHRLTYGPDLTVSEMKKEFHVIAQGLRAALQPGDGESTSDEY